MSKNISQYFRRKHLISIVKFKNFTPGVKFRSSKLIGKHKISQKVKICTNRSNLDVFGGGTFWEDRDKFREEIIRPMKMLVFGSDYRGSGICRIGVKILSRWGKNSVDGVKIHQVSTNETVKCFVQLFTRIIHFCVLV